MKKNLENSIKKIEEASCTGHDREDYGKKLHALLCLSTEWHQCLQKRLDEASQRRKAWEEEYPVQVAQENKLLLYTQSLQPLLDVPTARAIPARQWQEAEISLSSLQVYLMDNKISAEQIRSGREKGIEAILRDLLRQIEEWDIEGLGFQKDDRVDLEIVENIWGRVDKIGSRLNYLLILDTRGDIVDRVVSLINIGINKPSKDIS